MWLYVVGPQPHAQALILLAGDGLAIFSLHPSYVFTGMAKASPKFPGDLSLSCGGDPRYTRLGSSIIVVLNCVLIP